jgi:hypothetical protein
MLGPFKIKKTGGRGVYFNRLDLSVERNLPIPLIAPFLK